MMLKKNGVFVVILFGFFLLASFSSIGDVGVYDVDSLKDDDFFLKEYVHNTSIDGEHVLKVGFDSRLSLSSSDVGYRLVGHPMDIENFTRCVSISKSVKDDEFAFVGDVHHWGVYHVDIQPVIKGNFVLEKYAWWNSSFGYCKTIKVNYSQVPETLYDFPVNVNITESYDFLLHARDDGRDIVFVNHANTTVLDFEVEYYSGGTLYAWVNLPVVWAGNYTYFNMYYNNSEQSVSLQNVTNTWNSGYASVFHFNDSAGNVNDSTQYDRNSISPESTPLYEQIGVSGYGVYLDGDPNAEGWQMQDNYDLWEDSHSYTVECWYTTTNVDTMRLWNGYGEALMIAGIMEGGTQVNFYTHDGAWDILGSNIYPKDCWVYSAFVRDVSTGKFIHINGSQVNSNGWVGVNSGRAESNAIGCNADSNDDGFLGYIDEIRISSVVRNTSWLRTTYNTIYNNSYDGIHSFLIFGAEQTAPTPPEPTVYNITLTYVNQTIDCPCCLNFEFVYTNSSGADFYFYWYIEGVSEEQFNVTIGVDNGTIGFHWNDFDYLFYEDILYFNASIGNSSGREWENFSIVLGSKSSCGILTEGSNMEVTISLGQGLFYFVFMLVLFYMVHKISYKYVGLHVPIGFVGVFVTMLSMSYLTDMFNYGFVVCTILSIMLLLFAGYKDYEGYVRS